MTRENDGMAGAGGATGTAGGEPGIDARGLERLGLRLRIFLFFALIAGGGAAIVAGAAAFGHAKLDELDPGAAIAASAAIAIFLLVGLVLAVWLLFDEHVARPLTALAADLRAKAHADVATGIDTRLGRYLGDLAPAASAVASDLSRTRAAVSEAVARETARLSQENARLAAILEVAPFGVVAASRDGRIALYNGRASALLGGPTFVGLGRPLPPALAADLASASDASPGGARLVTIPPDGGAGEAICVASLPLPAHGAGAGDPGGVRVLFLREEPGPRPGGDGPQAPPVLVHDVGVLDRPPPPELEETRLDALSLVVFDTETTGLYPERDDEIVQIGAVRMLGTRVLAAEAFETLVDPGRHIPGASVRVHGITDARVAGAPPIAEAGRAFLRFCAGSVPVAHNAPFDLACFERHATAIGARFEGPVLDTILLAAVVYGQAVPHGLDELAARLGVAVDESARHTALGDALVTARILACLIPTLRERGVVTLADALAASRRHRRAR